MTITLFNKEYEMNIHECIEGYKLLIEDLFTNYNLSIITGEYTYGGNHGLYEIAFMKKDTGEWATKLLGEDVNDDVIGYLSADDIEKYINKFRSIVENSGEYTNE